MYPINVIYNSHIRYTKVLTNRAIPAKEFERMEKTKERKEKKTKTFKTP